MNKTEQLFFRWLLRQGYNPDDIHYRGNSALDFTTSDGKKWEVKRLYDHKILIQTSGRITQWDILFDDPENTEIVVMDEKHEAPLLRIPVKNISKSTRFYEGIEIYLFGEHRTVDTITISINKELLEEIDEKRGITSRSAYIGSLLEDALGTKKKLMIAH